MVNSGLDFVLLLVGSLGLSVIFGGVCRLIAPGTATEELWASLGIGFGILPVLVIAVWTNAYRKDKAADVKVKLAAIQSVPAPVPPSPPPPAPPDDAHEQAWRTALERFFRAGDKAGSFSIRALQGVVGSTTWAALTDFYCAQAGGNILRRVPGDEGTTWGHGWRLDDVTRKLALGQLPHPDGVVPTVELYVGNSTSHDTKRQRTTAKKAAVVDIPPSKPYTERV